jgi:hypothetical protein
MLAILELPMVREKTVWNLLTLAVGLFGVAVPLAALIAQYDLAARGSNPEKHIQLQTTAAIDPSAIVAGSILETTIRVGNTTFEHVYVSQAILRNVGQSPIVASDFVEPIAVNAKTPWRIVAVENSKLGADSPTVVQLSWKRATDTRFEAAPALINPGDTIFAHVYLAPADPVAKDRGQPEIGWTTRIVNMRAFEIVPMGGSVFDEQQNWGIHVDLRGWSTIFTVVFALLFQAKYLYLLTRLGAGRNWNSMTVAVVLGSSLLSWAAAESMATYFFPAGLTRILGVSHWLNAPPILLHVATSVILWWKARASYRTTLTKGRYSSSESY